MKLPFSYDPLTGIRRTFHYDESQDAKNFIIETTQPTDAIVDANRLAFNDAPRRVGKEEFVRVASIPLNLFFDLKKRGILNDPKALKRWLNDPDNRAFRTRPGVI